MIKTTILLHRLIISDAARTQVNQKVVCICIRDYPHLFGFDAANLNMMETEAAMPAST